MVSIKYDYPISLLPRYYSLEFHPWEVNLAKLDTISKELLQNATAIGEIGLDAFKGPTLDIQLAVFNSY
jgi:Tat protein secretion system quality control protein TatD with DNase activity